MDKYNDNEVYRLRDKIDGLKADRNGWKDKDKKRRKERDNLKSKLETIEYDIDRLKLENKEWKHKLEKCEKDRNSWKAKYHRLEHERITFKRQQKNLEWENNELLYRVKEWKKSTKNLSIKTKICHIKQG